MPRRPLPPVRTVRRAFRPAARLLAGALPRLALALAALAAVQGWAPALAAEEPDAVLARVNGRLMLLDWKSGNRVYPEHVCQVAAYRQLLREHREEAPDSALLLRVGKDFADFTGTRARPTLWDVAAIHAAARANLIYVREDAAITVYKRRDHEASAARLGRILAGEHDGTLPAIPAGKERVIRIIAADANTTLTYDPPLPGAATTLAAAALTACAPEVPETPTWLQDVRPIVLANCVRCHTPPPIGGAPDNVRFDKYADEDRDGSGGAAGAEGTDPPGGAPNVGVGGGTVIVPLLILWLAYGDKEATGTSMAAIIVMMGESRLKYSNEWMK